MEYVCCISHVLRQEVVAETSKDLLSRRHGLEIMVQCHGVILAWRCSHLESSPREDLLPSAHTHMAVGSLQKILWRKDSCGYWPQSLISYWLKIAFLWERVALHKPTHNNRVDRGGGGREAGREKRQEGEGGRRRGRGGENGEKGRRERGRGRGGKGRREREGREWGDAQGETGTGQGRW